MTDLPKKITDDPYGAAILISSPGHRAGPRPSVRTPANSAAIGEALLGDQATNQDRAP